MRLLCVSCCVLECALQDTSLRAKAGQEGGVNLPERGYCRCRTGTPAQRGEEVGLAWEAPAGPRESHLDAVAEGLEGARGLSSPLAVGQGCEVQFTFRPLRHVQIWQGWWSGTQVSRNCGKTRLRRRPGHDGRQPRGTGKSVPLLWLGLPRARSAAGPHRQTQAEGRCPFREGRCCRSLGRPQGSPALCAEGMANGRF